jgi:hypothetical protein
MHIIYNMQKANFAILCKQHTLDVHSRSRVPPLPAGTSVVGSTAASETSVHPHSPGVTPRRTYPVPHPYLLLYVLRRLLSSHTLVGPHHKVPHVPSCGYHPRDWPRMPRVPLPLLNRMLRDRDPERGCYFVQVKPKRVRH